MSTQPTPIVIGPRFNPAAELPGASDLQKVIDRVLVVLRRRRWLFALPSLTGMIAVLVVSLFLPRIYSMNAMFERRDDPVLADLIQLNSPYSFKMLRKSIALDLLSKQALEHVVEQANKPQAQAGAATGTGTGTVVLDPRNAQTLMSRIKVNVIEKGEELDFIELSYSGDDPAQAAIVMNGLKDRYIEYAQQKIHDVLKRSEGFFEAEATKRSEQLIALQTELLQMAAQNPGVSPTQPDLLDQMIFDARNQIESMTRRHGQLTSDLAMRDEYAAELAQRAATGEPALPDAAPSRWVLNPQRQQLTSAIEALQGEIDDAMTLRGMTEQHPTVRRLIIKRDRLKVEQDALPEYNAVDRQPTAATPNPVDALAAERQRVALEQKSLGEQIAQLSADIASKQAELAKLTADKSTLPDRPEAYVTRQQELERATGDYETRNSHLTTIKRTLTAKENDRGVHFRTVYAANAPMRPLSPSIGGVFFLSIGIGLAMGTAAVFLREIFDRSYRDIGRVKRSLGIPVLEAIGEIQLGGARRTWVRRFALPGVVTVQAVLLIVASTLVYMSLEHPKLYKHVLTQSIAAVS
mgnify:CR=1 FL=1